MKFLPDTPEFSNEPAGLFRYPAQDPAKSVTANPNAPPSKACHLKFFSTIFFFIV